MDVVKFESKLMLGAISKAISIAIKKKLGHKVNLTINALKITLVGGRARIHLDIDGEMEPEDLTNLLKSVGLSD